MKKVLLPLLVAAAAAALYIRQAQNPSSSIVSALPALGSLESFALTDQNGQEFNNNSLKGKVWLASFMFTSCQGPCPLMNQKYAKIHKDMNQIENFHQISVTMDPDNDDPDTLREYGETFQADFSRWSFLTGSKEQVISIAKDIFRLPAGEDPNLHSTRFVLIDQLGNIRGFYDSLDPEALKKLDEHIKALNSAPPVS